MCLLALSLNSIELTTSVYVMIFTCKKDPNKNLKVAFFDSIEFG